jgi:heptosyltransferase III
MRRLLIRPGAIGDCLLSFPALQYLVTDETEIWIPTPLVPLVSFGKRVRSIASTGLNLFGIADDSAVREALGSFDEIVSWYGANRPDFREPLQSLGPRCRFHAALPPPENHLHATDFFASQVGAPLGLQPRVYATPSSARGTVVLHPFSGSARKNWPLARFQALAARMPLPVEWLVGPEESLSGATCIPDLQDLAAWIAGARAYVGNDSGITHLAAAIGVPTLALFGPTDPAIWSPRGTRASWLRSDPLGNLDPERVLSALGPWLT